MTIVDVMKWCVIGTNIFSNECCVVMDMLFFNSVVKLAFDAIGMHGFCSQQEEVKRSKASDVNNNKTLNRKTD